MLDKLSVAFLIRLSIVQVTFDISNTHMKSTYFLSH